MFLSLICFHDHLNCDVASHATISPLQDLLLMRALSTVAEWLLPEPQTCASIACENGIVSPLGPEALSWAGNVGEPAAYKLIRMWQSRKLPISRLHDALVRHHHNAAASELAPFCHDVSKTASMCMYVQ